MAEQLGENVKVEIKGDEAIITINLKHRGRPSSSGKSIIVATTEGNKPIPGTNVVIGINCYIPNKK